MWQNGISFSVKSGGADTEITTVLVFFFKKRLVLLL